jgi:hypothetical protein
MDLNMVLQFVRPELLIVLVACYVLGLFLKQSTIKDWLIPFIILAFAIVLTILYIAVVLGEGLSGKVIIVGFIQGLITAALAVFGNQLIKQAIEKQ